ncbi:uncharacterized protein TNCV_449331 [Trichonephila clavipes]|nr:uncharacterized protein TNCV_449331 [Trichonephila clavipes]
MKLKNSTSTQVERSFRKMAEPTQGLLETEDVNLNHGQVTWTTPELAAPLLTTTPHQREDVSALDRFNVHWCPTRRVFSGTGLELQLPTRTTQPTSRIGTWTSTFAGLKEDTCTKDSLAADPTLKELSFLSWLGERERESADFFTEY